MIDILKKSKDIFKNCTPDDLDTPYNYTSVILNSKPLTGL